MLNGNLDYVVIDEEPAKFITEAINKKTHNRFACCVRAARAGMTDLPRLHRAGLSSVFQPYGRDTPIKRACGKGRWGLLYDE